MHLTLALLRRRFAEKESGELARIERETDKLSNLVQQLLLLAGLEAGSRPAENLATVSVRSLCESIVEDANFEAAQASCQVTGSRVDVTRLAYPQLLRRAIDNVLRNALRYAPAGSEIRVDCNAANDHDNILIVVTDGGPSVSESILKDIFLPFFRTEPGRDEGGGGTGLGLAIASEAIAIHGGTITAHNRKGCFEVRMVLPLKSTVREERVQQRHCQLVGFIQIPVPPVTLVSNPSPMRVRLAVLLQAGTGSPSQFGRTRLRSAPSNRYLID